MPNYSGSWTLQSQMQAQGASAWPVPFVPVYIEDTFSTYLYTGTGAAQTITNGINLATNGGLVWVKQRNVAIEHFLYDTTRGVTKSLSTNDTTSEYTNVDTLTAFGSTGFTLGSSNFVNGITSAPRNYASWTFRKQPKFFDVQTFTTAASVPTYSFSHNLASTPGCIIIKSLGTDDWYVWHTSLNPAYNLVLNQSSGQANRGATWITTVNSTTIASTVTGGPNPLSANTTYVAYIFASNAGGFGLTGTDNVISCGTFTTDGTGAAGNITLGYESQWVMFKRSDGVGNWQIVDTMRGSSLTSYNYISPTVSNAESSSTSTQGIYPTATGFYVGNNFPGANQTYVYIAIRRGPMKVPTLGTSVFEPAAYTGTGTNPRTVGTLQVTDLAINMNRTDAGDVPLWVDRLRGPERYLYSSGSAAEAGGLTGWLLAQSGQTINGIRNTSPTTYVDWLFRRAPGFFDVVCYTGTGSDQTIAHNLGAIPELIIVKSRSNASTDWLVKPEVNSAKYLQLNDATSIQGPSTTIWSSSNQTASNFYVGVSAATGASGYTYVAYLFATLAEVSKVGSYTGTGLGNMQQINCGFTTGARFVMIKRTDATGDWYVWDSARGIIAGNDPYLLMNSTAAEITTTDYVDTIATGFEVSATAPAALNATGGTYIFLAIA